MVLVEIKGPSMEIPTLKHFLKYYEQVVVQDRITVLSCFFTCISAYSDSPLNLFLRGESSTGKTHNARNVSSLFPSEDVWVLGGLSPTALVHQRGILVDEKGIPIDFTLKPDPKDKEAVREWAEKMANAREVVDLSNKILLFLEAPSEETLMMLRPILSHDKREISYKFTDRKGKSLRTVEVVVRGWPATIFCTPRVKYLEELSTRSFSVSPVTSEEKFRGAMMVSARLASSIIFAKTLEKQAEWLREYLEMVKKYGREMQILIPYASVLGELFYANMPRAMRDFNHYLSLIKAVTLFNFPRRPCVETPDGIVILATLKDKTIADMVFGNIRETTLYGLPENVLQFYRLLLEKNLSGFTVKDAETLFNSVQKQGKKSSWAIRKWLESLEAANLVSSEPDPDDRRVLRYVTLNGKNIENVGNSWNPRILERYGYKEFQKWFRINVGSWNQNMRSFSLFSSQRMFSSPNLKEIYRQIMGFDKLDLIFFHSPTRFQDSFPPHFWEEKGENGSKILDSNIFPTSKNFQVKGGLSDSPPCAFCGKPKAFARLIKGELIYLHDECQEQFLKEMGGRR